MRPSAIRQRSAAFPWLHGKPPHLPCVAGDLPQAVLFPGDPGRVDLFRSVLDDFRIVGQNREFRVGVGSFEGIELGVCSTGIGGPSTEIALVEAAELGCRIALRVGGGGALQPDLRVGSLLIVAEALRGGGAAAFYDNSTTPARAHPQMIRALTLAAEAQGVAHAAVTVASTDSYYAGQGRRYPHAPENVSERLEQYARLGVAALDMEAESVVVIGNAVGMVSGAVLAVHGNRMTDEWMEDFAPAQLQLMRVASSALARLVRESVV